MARVVCDTSFLMHVASRRIKNAGSLETEIGRLDYAVPASVLGELAGLSADPRKGAGARAAARYAAGLEVVAGGGGRADDDIVGHVRRHGGIVATMDRELKGRVRRAGGSVLSVASDRVVLEG